jgi:hypothetical protein
MASKKKPIAIHRRTYADLCRDRRRENQRMKLALEYARIKLTELLGPDSRALKQLDAILAGKPFQPKIYQKHPEQVPSLRVRLAIQRWASEGAR